METRRTFTSATRTLSASNLRERLSSLSSLTTTPLKPPTLPKIHANIEYVLCALVHSSFSPVGLVFSLVECCLCDVIAIYCCRVPCIQHMYLYI